MGIKADGGKEREPSTIMAELQAASPTKTAPHAFTITNASPSALKFFVDMAEAYDGIVTQADNNTATFTGRTLIGKLGDCGVAIKGFTRKPALTVIDGGVTR